MVPEAAGLRHKFRVEAIHTQDFRSWANNVHGCVVGETSSLANGVLRRLSCRALRTRTVILTNDTDCERIVYLGLVNRLLGHTHVDGPVEELFERCFRKKLLLNRNAKANQQQCEIFPRWLDSACRSKALVRLS